MAGMLELLEQELKKKKNYGKYGKSRQHARTGG